MGCVLHHGCKDMAGDSVVTPLVKGGARQFTSSIFVAVKPPTFVAAELSYGGKVFPLGRECAELSDKWFFVPRKRAAQFFSEAAHERDKSFFPSVLG